MRVFMLLYHTVRDNLYHKNNNGHECGYYYTMQYSHTALQPRVSAPHQNRLLFTQFVMAFLRLGEIG